MKLPNGFLSKEQLYSGGRHMKDAEANGKDEMKKELENLNARIRDALKQRTLSAEELQTLIKETEEIQKRLVGYQKNPKEKEEKT
jgi:ribosome-binding protein aMBF1 (putative translation factor)